VGWVLENYSAAAQRVVSAATSEARELDHPRIGTEHLLLGLLSDDGDVADLLRSFGASLSASRHIVAEVVRSEPGSTAEDALPFTPRAQRALDRAGRFSRQQRKPEVGVEHVLLGVLDVEGLACQVLRGLDVDVVHLREAAAGRGSAVEAPLVDDPEVEPNTVRPTCPWCSALLEGTLAQTTVAARGESGSSTDVVVVHCGSCGVTLGVLRPT
jgi:ATP-dependent Clp protease ATP-binding subunit ClpA